MEGGGTGPAVLEGTKEKAAGCQQGSLQPRPSFPLFPHLLQHPELNHFTEFTFTLLNATKPSN